MEPSNGVVQPTQQTPKTVNKTKMVWGLICLIAPTALIFLTILLYAVFNFFAVSSSPSVSETDQLLGSSSSGNSIANIILFLVGALSIITWLPGIIVGIILLATSKK